MLQPSIQSDPLVEILRLAYRRGLALRQEKAKEPQKDLHSAHDVQPTEIIDFQPEMVQAEDCN